MSPVPFVATLFPRVMGFYRKMTGFVLRHPRLLPELIGAAWAFRARGWARRPPFLPLPPAEYLRWRMETAYGDPDAFPPDEDFARYLRWASSMRGRT